MTEILLLLLMTSCLAWKEHSDVEEEQQEMSTTTNTSLPTLTTGTRPTGDRTFSGQDVSVLKNGTRDLTRLRQQAVSKGRSAGQPGQQAQTPHNNNVSNTTDSPNDTLISDLMSLFMSSSPGDLQDDADFEEFLKNGILWTADPQLRKRLIPYFRRIVGKGLVTRKMYRRFKRVVLYLKLPLLLIGLVTNIIALRVFRRLSRNVTNMYMTCLIGLDVAYLLFVLLTSCVALMFRLGGWAPAGVSELLWIRIVYRYLILCSRQVIIMATAYMCVDRYFIIASPFRTRKSSVLRSPRALIVLTFAFILAFNCHVLLKREVKSAQLPGSNSTVSYLAYTHFYLQHQRLLGHLGIASSCLFQYCPLLVMLVANLCLIRSLHRHTQAVTTLARDVVQDRQLPAAKSDNSCSRHNSRGSVFSTTSSTSTATQRTTDSSSSRQFFQLQRTKCVVVIAYSFLFFLLALPLALLPVLNKAIPEFSIRRNQHYLFLMYIGLLPVLDILSASINLFVFLVKGSTFRGHVRSMLCCQGQEGKSGVFTLRSSGACGSEDDPNISSVRDSQSVVLKGSIKRGDG